MKSLLGMLFDSGSVSGGGINSMAAYCSAAKFPYQDAHWGCLLVAWQMVVMWSAHEWVNSATISGRSCSLGSTSPVQMR